MHWSLPDHKILQKEIWRRKVKNLKKIQKNFEKIFQKIFNNFPTRCPICFQNFIKGQAVCRIKTCKHIIHPECFESAVYFDNRCPLCRRNLTTGGILSYDLLFHPIYQRRRKIADETLVAYQAGKKLGIEEAGENLSGYGSILNEVLTLSRNGSIGKNSNNKSEPAKKSCLKKIIVRNGKVIKTVKIQGKKKYKKKSKFYKKKEKNEVSLREEEKAFSAFSGDSGMGLLKKVKDEEMNAIETITEEKSESKSKSKTKSRSKSFVENVESNSLKGLEETEDDFGAFDSELLDEVNEDAFEFDLDEDDEFAAFGQPMLLRHQSAA